MPKSGLTGKFQGDSPAFMRVCGQQRHFWLLTVNRMDFCAATVASMRCCLAISEEKARAPAIVAAWLVVDRWNYIIKDLSVTASRHQMSAVCA